MSEFKKFHPIVIFLYFTFTIIFAIWLINPVNLLISFVCNFLYLFVINGKKAIKKVLLLAVPTIIVASFINAAFNHEGITILSYLPDGNPLTFESIIYGFLASVMISSVFLYFSCFNELMTSDKYIYLFGKLMPSLSLILSMTLRFVPRFTCYFKNLMRYQRNQDNKGNIKKIKIALKSVSATTSWALENSIDTADSMKSRGFGIKRRTSYSIFKFTKRDLIILFFILIAGIYIIFGKVTGVIDYVYFPKIIVNKINPYVISLYISHFLLCILPIIIEVSEVIKWKFLKLKI
ncbi:MAG: energy-coupling factor transporter transmembrane protein EcfT [Clostridia bacterium]|nr:energy-coupling factor transporter transmembrane protein EcfT [Clostridia bacterium]